MFGICACAHHRSNHTPGYGCNSCRCAEFRTISTTTRRSILALVVCGLTIVFGVVCDSYLSWFLAGAATAVVVDGAFKFFENERTGP